MPRNSPAISKIIARKRGMSHLAKVTGINRQLIYDCFSTFHSLLGLIIPPVARDVVRRHYADKLSSHIKSMAEKSGMTEQQAYELIHSDD